MPAVCRENSAHQTKLDCRVLEVLDGVKRMRAVLRDSELSAVLNPATSAFRQMADTAIKAGDVLIAVNSSSVSGSRSAPQTGEASATLAPVPTKNGAGMA